MTDMQIVHAIFAFGVALIALGAFLTYRNRAMPCGCRECNPGTLSRLCACGHVFGVHRAVTHGQAAPCKSRDSAYTGHEACDCRGFQPKPCEHKRVASMGADICIDCGAGL